MALAFRWASVTYKGRGKLEDSKEETPVLGWTALLNIELRKGHEVTVCQAIKQPTRVESTNVSRGHHDDVRDAAQAAGEPETSFPTEPCRDETSGARAQEGAEGHER